MYLFLNSDWSIASMNIPVAIVATGRTFGLGFYRCANGLGGLFPLEVLRWFSVSSRFFTTLFVNLIIFSKAVKLAFS